MPDHVKMSIKHMAWENYFDSNRAFKVNFVNR